MRRAGVRERNSLGLECRERVRNLCPILGEMGFQQGSGTVRFLSWRVSPASVKKGLEEEGLDAVR